MPDRPLSRRSFLKTMGAGSVGLAAAGRFGPLGAVEDNPPSAKPNIVVFLADDLGYASIGCQGYRDTQTPNIDSIASNGVRCTAGYVSCPVCSPTRAGLVTGRYQQRFGHEDNPGPPPVCSPNFGLPEQEKTLGDYLQVQGYATGVFGKWHLGHRPACHPLKRGFDEFFGFLTGAHDYDKTLIGTDNPLLRGMTEIEKEEYLTDAIRRESLSFIDRHKDKPFFLYIPFNAVHHPLQAPERYKESFKNVSFPRRGTYAGMLRAMDDAVGAVLSRLRGEGLERNTLIFFLGDNGGYRLPGESLNLPLRGYKGDTFEGGVRVPFLVQWKGKLPSGAVYDRPVLSLDIVPTALAAAGANVPSIVEGVDLMPHLGSKTASGVPNEAIFWRMLERTGARVGDWKLVRMGGAEPVGGLYNLAEDVGETKDLSKSNPSKLKELEDAYEEWNARNIAPKWLDGRRPEAKRTSEASGTSE